MYFEYNLPSSAPYWLHPSCINAFNEMLHTVSGRMERLEDALAASGQTGAVFAKYAKQLFDANQTGFDKLSADQIAAYTTTMDDGSPVEERLEWPNATVVVDTAFVTTKEWESLRHFGIGGSDAAIVKGISPYRTATSLYHDKVGTPILNPKAVEDKAPIFQRGHETEDRVINAFCKISGAKRIPETRMFASKKYPCCTANIDAILQFSDGRIFVGEAKTTIADNWAAWVNDKIPAHYVPQTHQYPAVLDDDRVCGTYIFCLFTNDYDMAGQYIGSIVHDKELIARHVERMPALEEAQLQEEAAWFTTYVEGTTEPEATGSAEDEKKAVAPYKAPVDDEEDALTWDQTLVEDQVQKWLELGEKRKQLKTQVDALDEQQKKIAAELIDLLDTAPQANVDLGNGQYWEIKNAPRSKTTTDLSTLLPLIDAAAAMLPDNMVEAMRNCITTDPAASRVFSIKVKKKKVK